MMYVSSSGLSGNSLESRVLGLFSSVLSTSAAMVVAEPSGMETCQRVSLSAAMSSNSGVFLALIASLRSSTVFDNGMSLIEKAFDAESPSTRHHRVRRLSAMVLRSIKRNVKSVLESEG